MISQNNIMKKFYLFSSILLSTIAFSQTYHFDILTKYSIQNTAKKEILESTNYFNTDDFSYHLRITRSPEAFTGTILDITRKIAHRFSITETKVNGDYRFQFKYENSFSYDTNSFKNLRIELSGPPDISSKKFNLKIFPRQRAKKYTVEHQLTLIPANKNLFPMYRVSMMHPYEKMNEVNIPGNYMVSKDVMKRGDITCEFILKEFKNVDFDLVVPKTLKRSLF
jgi:hypothetical protein